MNALVKLFKYIFDFSLKDTLGVDLNVNVVIFAIAIGFCVSVFVINIKQAKTSRLLLKLIRKEAFSEEKALSLRQLGFGNNRSYKTIAERKEGILKTIIFTANKERGKGNAKKIIDTEGFYSTVEAATADETKNSMVKGEKTYRAADKYYIPHEAKSKAMKLLGKSGSPIIRSVLSSIIIIGCAFALASSTPYLAKLIELITK